MGWKKGDIVMEALPFTHVIMQVYREERCNLCLKSCEELKRCAACKQMWYCQQTCQKEDWKLHKMECPIFQRVPDLPTDSIRLYLRLILLHQMGKAVVRLDKSETPCIRIFNDLQSHAKEIQIDEKRWELFEIASDFIRAYTHDIITCPTDGKMLDIFGKMVINTFTVTDEMLQDVAVGLYNSPSILNHRCKANAAASFDGRRLTIRLLEDIPSQDLSQVFVSYIDSLAPTKERQDQLQHQYYFTCTCDRCLDPEWDKLVTSPSQFAQDDINNIKSCMAKLERMRKDKEDPKAMVEMCRNCLESIDLLEETDIHLVRLVGKAFDVAIEGQMWKEAKLFGRRKLGQYRSLIPEDKQPGTGLFYATLGKLLVFLEQVEEAFPHLKQAFEIFRPSLGDHTLTRETVELMQQCQAEMDRTGACVRY